MTLGPKTKIAMGVAAALGVLALGVTLIAHSRAQGAQDTASGDTSSFPGLLFAASPTPSQIATGGSTMGDGTTGLMPAANSSLDSIAAALSAALAQITANKDTVYNTNAASLFSQLPKTLSGASIEDFLADFGGFNVHAHVTYRSSATPGNSSPTPSPSTIGGTNAANTGGIGSLGGASVIGSSTGEGGFGGFSSGPSDSGLDFGAPDFGGGDFGGASDSGGAGSAAADGGAGAADGGAGGDGGGDGGGE